MWLVAVYNIVLVDCICNCDCGPGLCKFQRLCKASTGRHTEGDSTEKEGNNKWAADVAWGRQEKPLRSTTPFRRTTHSSRDTNMFLDFALYDLSNSVETNPIFKLKESWICLVYVMYV